MEDNDMKKVFCVSVDFTMSKRIYVAADCEEEAMAQAEEKITLSPYDYAREFSHYVSHEIIDAEEEKE